MKILLIDIETAPSVAYVWGLFQENIPLERLITPGYILCWAAKWYGKDEVMFNSVNTSSRKDMLKEIYGLLNEADVVMHYYGTKFDIPSLNREFIKFDLKPPKPHVHLDLLKTVKKQFKLDSYKLAHVLDYLGVGQKPKHSPFSMWIGCIEGDQDSWQAMEDYNKNDVVQLENLYNKLQGWIPNHPNRGLYLESDNCVCPYCASDNLVSRGYRRTKTRIYKRFQCKDCGGWSSARLSEKRGDSNILSPT
ncbi:MAG: ribonuclease H-like domain-containing protein [Nitrosopumilaceae archaeon]